MIPVCVPLIGGRELEYVKECIDTNWISSKGRFVEEFERSFAEYCGCEYGISTTNGTTALHLALATAGIDEKDEVIIPTFTIISTALAVLYCGAKPVLVDSDPVTLNIDPSMIEARITDKTAAILPVHMYGHPCDMDPIMQIAEDHDIFVIEDAAEVHGAEYHGKRCGGIGDIGCFSFYANKIITTGEGGMVITNDEGVAENAKKLRNLDFPEGSRTYLHERIGFNYRMTNIQAALGLAQLERIDDYIEMRRRNAFQYSKYLNKIKGIQLPVELSGVKNVYWMYALRILDDFGCSRDQLMSELAKHGIETRPFFVPMHRQPVLRKLGLTGEERFPVADLISHQGLYLPSGSGLRDDEIAYICDKIIDVRDQYAS